MQKRSSLYIPGIILFALFLVISIFTFKDYGVAWDEPIQRDIGTVYYNYVAHNDRTLIDYNGREYGAGFELPLIFLEKKLQLTDTRDVYLMRHLVTHLFFLLAAFCGYVLCYRLFKDRFVACLGFMLLVCNPRIYAHSFFNTKDIPLLSMFLITFMLAQLAFERNKLWLYVFLGAACGYATAIRILGILLPAVLGTFLIIDLIAALIKKQKAGAALGKLLLFAIAFVATLYVSWPTLWHEPIANFRRAYNVLSHFSNWNSSLIFMGHVYTGDTIPWYYAPVWFLISTPVLWLTLGVGGIALIAVAFIHKPLSFITNTGARNYTLYIACLLLPVAAVIIHHSVLYDDWRHLYFIYPAFVLIALFAVHKLVRTKWKTVVGGLCLAQVLIVGIFMVRAHPFQQLYFNELVSHKDEALKKNYDYEYWGCSYKQALDYILAHDKSDTIRVFWSLHPVINNVNLLPVEDRKRILLVNRNEKPYYFVTNFRNRPHDFEQEEIFYNIKVQNSSLLRVYKCY